MLARLGPSPHVADIISALVAVLEMARLGEITLTQRRPLTSFTVHSSVVYSDGKVTLGDAVFLGPNVYIGKDCILGDFVEITNSILLGKNTVGKKAKIENSIVGDDVDVPAGQIIKGGLILHNEKQN